MKITLKRTPGLLSPVAALTFAMIVATTVTVGPAVAATSSLVPATTANVRLAPPASGNVSSSTATMQSFSTMSAAENYWTAGRLTKAAATPKTAATPRPAAGSTAPALKAAASGRLTDIPAVVGSLPATKPETLQAKVTRPYTNRPDRLNGKVFFTQGGRDYVCSGTVVNSTNKDMIDTAGHCVSDGAGHFVTNWIFIPGYASTPTGGKATGMYPYGIWTARRLTTTAQWHYFGNIKQDVAYGVVSALSNRHIAAYLGGQGTYFNACRNQVFSAFGYPQAAPFNGMDQRVSVSGRIGDDLLLGGLAGPLPIRIASNQTGGTSGGGWIVGISKTTGLGHVNGHNSYRYLSGPAANSNQLYSPYYGNEALALYNYTRVL